MHLKLMHFAAAYCPWSVACTMDPDANPARALMLVKDWDDTPSFREKMRQHGSVLLVPGPDGNGTLVAPDLAAGEIPKSVKVARCNMDTMLPVFKCMADEAGLKLPNIDMLLEAVSCVYKKYRLDPHTCRIYKDSWGIRRLAQLVKSRLYKPRPPQEHP